MMNLCLNSCHSNGGEVAKGAALARQPSFRARRSTEILVENEADCVEQSEAEKSLRSSLETSPSSATIVHEPLPDTLIGNPDREAQNKSEGDLTSYFKTKTMKSCSNGCQRRCDQMGGV
jgi:hypothetical protein